MTAPAHKFRISNLQATIWRNSGGNGDWYSVILAPLREIEARINESA